MKKCLLVTVALFGGISLVRADNPLVSHLYTADPTARVFDGVLYVYPSHDIEEFDGLTGSGGFMMEDYHVFSTTNLMNYEDHGVALSQDEVTWAAPNYTMWAPDCVRRGSNYYFYFPVNFKVGVAVSTSPTGPFVPEPAAIATANGIDPCVFEDDDGTSYLYFGGGVSNSLKVMRLQNDMKTPDMAPQTLTGLGAAYKEGSFVFKRNGIYYFTYPYAPDGSEEIHYATGSSPLGPFTAQGTLLDRWTDGCWTDHHSIVEYQGQWYIFYHHMDLSGDKSLRSMCADRLTFNPDGTIPKVTPTRRGIGIRNAEEPVQVDRYLDGSAGLSTPRFPADEAAGLYLSGIDNSNWIHYPGVDFGPNGFETVSARVACSTAGGTIELRAGSTSGTRLGSLTVSGTGGSDVWDTVTGSLDVSAQSVQGVTNLYLVFSGSGSDLFNIDWIRFNRPGTAHLDFAGRGVGEVLIDGSRTVKTFHTSAVLDAPSAVSLTAAPYDGSLFDGWILNGVTVSNISSLQAGDQVTAVFKEDYPVRNMLTQKEAETFTEQSGIQVEPCSDEGGGQQIGYIENGDTLVFRNADFKDGVASFAARASSLTAGGTISVCIDDPESTPICQLTIPGTGGWNQWKTMSALCSSVSGIHDLYLQFEGGAGFLFNLNWFKFRPYINGLDIMEAEDYTSQFGIQTEPCSEGGLNIGYVQDGDYIAFEGVTFSSAVTSFAARVASGASGGTLTVCLNDINAAPICTLSISDTGGWQNWVPVSTAVSVPAGTHDVYVKFSGGGGYLFNVNWVQFNYRSGYAIWLDDNSVTNLTGYLDDGDGDGICNLMEYALDFNPFMIDFEREKLVVDAAGISVSYLKKPDVGVKLFYATDLTDAWTELVPSPLPAGMPAGTVYHLFDPLYTNGFFRWYATVL